MNDKTAVMGMLSRTERERLKPKLSLGLTL